MCQSLADGGRRCASSHRAVRATHRALDPALTRAVTDAGDNHPAAEAYAEAETWSDRTRQAVEVGDDDEAARCADRTRQAADRARALLTPATGAPQDDDTEGAGRTPAAVELPEHARAAAALAQATGAERTVALPRDDGGESIAWSQPGFAGSATVYPDGDDGHPYARLSFQDLDRDRYQALARSPWPYRTDGGRVLYERMPVDQAEQIITAARTGEAGRPWERHGLEGAEPRYRLPPWDADALEDESARWAEHLGPEQDEWTRTYTDHHYDAINEHLYAGRSLDDIVDGLKAPMRDITEPLDSAIASAETPDEPHLTYRGYTPPAEVIEYDCVPQWAHANFPVGGTYTSPSYTSVSHCPQVAVGFSDNYTVTPNGQHKKASHRVVFELLTSNGAPLAAVSEFDNDERERLLPRDGTYRVVGVHDNVDIDGKQAVLIQLVDTDEIPHH